MVEYLMENGHQYRYKIICITVFFFHLSAIQTWEHRVTNSRHWYRVHDSEWFPVQHIPVYRKMSMSSGWFVAFWQIQSPPISHSLSRRAVNSRVLSLCNRERGGKKIVWSWALVGDVGWSRRQLTDKWCFVNVNNQMLRQRMPYKIWSSNRRNVPYHVKWSTALRPDNSPSACTDICDLWTSWTISQWIDNSPRT